MLSRIAGWRLLGVGLLLLPTLLLTAPAPDRAAPAAATNRYVGAQACKNCHSGEAKGDQFAKWQDSKHAHAYELLGTPEAKEVGAKQGVDDPQHSPKCLPCHVTAYGLDRKEVKSSLQPELGVQCESCHGPGEQHIKKRFAAAAQQSGDTYFTLPAGEIDAKPTPEVCQKCHNPSTVTFKPFCFKERLAKILHLDPRKKRTPEELAALKCPCGDDCKCEQSECGGYDVKKPDVEGKKDGDKEKSKEPDEKKGGKG